MFVLMVAVICNLVSDYPSDVPRKAGCGDRFHYFRGRSGKRYLFSALAASELADFRSAVAIFARRMPDGRLAAFWASDIDALGRPATPDFRWPKAAFGTVALVHLLAGGEREREALLADLAIQQQQVLPSFSLAA